MPKHSISQAELEYNQRRTRIIQINKHIWYADRDIPLWILSGNGDFARTTMQHKATLEAERESLLEEIGFYG